MSNSTPPGWYPDPEPVPGAEGAHERFWDGTAWSGRTRPLPPGAAVAPAGPAGPGLPAAPASAAPAVPAAVPAPAPA
ncbi:DUF2510 domain-containing protein, partial [Kitasatospora sp. LaBMicrA B282]|uniref:DUF2510 domain-containing protein n=1 Tax=Kitasatospora sp. LaBMicrA B282 TaxID=3420949 RepID=UPI003D110619